MRLLRIFWIWLAEWANGLLADKYVLARGCSKDLWLPWKTVKWILLHRCELTWIPKMMFWKMYLLSEYRLFFGGVFASVLSHLLLPWGLWVVLYSIMGDIRGTQAAVSIDSIVGVLGKEGYDHVAGGALFCYTESKHFDPPAIESTLHLYNSPKHCLFLFVL